jgi:tetratricopeptide (TPR) repeat protein
LDAKQRIESGVETNLGTKILILERLVLISQRLGNTNEAVRYSTLLEPFLKEQNDDDYRSSFLIDWSVECANNGNMEKAEELADIVEDLLSNLSNVSKIRQYSQLGFVYIKTEKYNKSIDNINKGIKLAIQEKGDKCIELTTLYHNLGRAYMLKGDYSNALSALNKSKILQLELEGEVMQRTADYIKECESK